MAHQKRLTIVGFRSGYTNREAHASGPAPVGERHRRSRRRWLLDSRNAKKFPESLPFDELWFFRAKHSTAAHVLT